MAEYKDVLPRPVAIVTRLWIFVSNNGDGSPGVHFHRSQEDAEAHRDYELEHYGENYCDDVMQATLQFDKDGNLLNPNNAYDQGSE